VLRAQVAGYLGVRPYRRMMHVEFIDLGGVTDGAALLHRLGERLELGGPAGNHSVDAVNGMAGWGMNWDALADSLCYLDTGGIWGTSTKVPFPLLLRFENVEALRGESPEMLDLLKEVLERTKAAYGRSGKNFEYALE